MFSISAPTAPVAPTTATLYPMTIDLLLHQAGRSVMQRAGIKPLATCSHRSAGQAAERTARPRRRRRGSGWRRPGASGSRCVARRAPAAPGPRPRRSEPNARMARSVRRSAVSGSPSGSIASSGRSLAGRASSLATGRAKCRPAEPRSAAGCHGSRAPVVEHRRRAGGRRDPHHGAEIAGMRGIFQQHDRFRVRAAKDGGGVDLRPRRDRQHAGRRRHRREACEGRGRDLPDEIAQPMHSDPAQDPAPDAATSPGRTCRRPRSLRQSAGRA